MGIGSSPTGTLRPGGWHGPPWPGFFLGPLLFLTLAGIGLYLAWRRRPAGAAGAAGIVAERYARGEIDETEYRRRLTELRAKPGR